MSNLNNLTSKILNDAKEEADKIVKSAEEKAKQKYDLEIKKAIAKKQTLLENARRERELLSDRIKSSANLKARNDNGVYAKDIRHEKLHGIKKIF